MLADLGSRGLSWYFDFEAVFVSDFGVRCSFDLSRLDFSGVFRSRGGLDFEAVFDSDFGVRGSFDLSRLDFSGVLRSLGGLDLCGLSCGRCCLSADFDRLVSCAEADLDRLCLPRSSVLCGEGDFLVFFLVWCL